MNAKNVLTYAQDQEARFVSVRFTDLIGSWHHLTFPMDQLTEDSFEDGFGFDASSLRGWAAIHESDMLLVPEPSRFWIDPFTEDTTLCLIANAVERNALAVQEEAVGRCELEITDAEGGFDLVDSLTVLL